MILGSVIRAMQIDTFLKSISKSLQHIVIDYAKWGLIPKLIMDDLLFMAPSNLIGIFYHHNIAI